MQAQTVRDSRAQRASGLSSDGSFRTTWHERERLHFMRVRIGGEEFVRSVVLVRWDAGRHG